MRTSEVAQSPGASLAKELVTEVQALICDDWLASLSNISALLKQNLVDTNWIGFYLFKKGQLILGPFQGLPACTHIQMGRGVCGQSAQSRRTLRVRDVHQFSDHITCDALSRSELVVPIVRDGNLLGVLDLDSPLVDRFLPADQTLIETIVEVLQRDLPWPSQF